jgi:hypothetical protein
VTCAIENTPVGRRFSIRVKGNVRATFHVRICGWFRQPAELTFIFAAVTAIVRVFTTLRTRCQVME